MPAVLIALGAVVMVACAGAVSPVAGGFVLGLLTLGAGLDLARGK